MKVEMVIPDYKLTSMGLDFGECHIESKSSYEKGETVKFSFVAGYPNRDLMTEKSYFKVERKGEGEAWEEKFTDDDFCTQMHWFMMERSSMIRIVWKIPDDQDPGTYRIVFIGPVKAQAGGEVQFLKVEKEFEIE